MTKLQFHGVAYDSARHEQPSATPVEHTYRGQRFAAPLRRDAANVQPTKLSYRGQAYQRRSAEAAAQVNAN
jgi:hypothetical protein